jgi:type IV secretory pathway TraG/TraD family ATPase VirD4
MTGGKKYGLFFEKRRGIWGAKNKEQGLDNFIRDGKREFRRDKPERSSGLRSGKGVSFVRPACLDWDHSLIAIDLKEKKRFEKIGE